MSDVVIRHKTLLEALDTLNRLKATLGKDAHLNLSNYNLRIMLDLIDQRIEQDLRRNNSSSPQPIAPPPTERIDREILLYDTQKAELMEIETRYLEAWTAADGDPIAQQTARQQQQMANRQLRERIIEPFVRLDISPIGTLVYGGTFPKAINLLNPDGKFYKVHSLLHFSHPVSPEDLALRERRVQAEKIVRYRVPGLDDAIWTMQNQPVSDMDASGWRELLRTRLKTAPLALDAHLT